MSQYIEKAEKMTLPLIPLRDTVAFPGALHNFELTDEEDIMDAMARLRAIYPNAMKLTYDNTRTRTSNTIDAAEDLTRRSPLELFEELYELQNNRPFSGQQRHYLQTLLDHMEDSL